MPFKSKYGVARHIYIAISKAGSANHASSGDWTPAAGDVKISKDGGAAANVTNLPTAIAMGNSSIWDFSLTATEMQAAQVVVTIADSATKAVDDTGFEIETYGNASAQHAVDFADSVRAGLTALPNAAAGANGGLPLSVDASGRVDVLKINGTSQTARDIGASVLLSPGTGTGQLDFTSGVVKANLAQILGTALTETAGQIAAAFKKFFNVASPTGTVNDLPGVAPGGSGGLPLLDANSLVDADVKRWLATAPLALSSQRVQVDVEAMSATVESAISDAVATRLYEGSETLEQSVRIIRSGVAGKASGLDTNTPAYRDRADTKNRISATTDNNGNRLTVTTDGT